MPARQKSLILGSVAVTVVMLCCCLGSLFKLPGHVQKAHADAVPSVIIDTDIFTDVGDVGAIAQVNALMDMGQANLLAVGVDTNSHYSAECVDAVDTYYGHPDIPIGITNPVNSDHGPQPDFIYPCSQNYPEDLQYASSIPTTLTVYRQTLAAQPDHSVTMVCIGYEGRLSELLNSPPDGYSSLSGHDLIAQKVKELVIMGGKYPSSASAADNGPEWNFMIEPAAAKDVADNWPTHIIYDGAEVGFQIISGSGLTSNTPANNPVRGTYEIYNGPNSGRFSWDETATYYAITHDSSIFSEVGNGSNSIDGTTGANTWVSSPVKDQVYLTLLDANSAQNVFDTLLNYVPGSSGGITPTATNTPAPTPSPTPTGGGPLPSPWQSQDIGSVAAAGSASYTSGTFSMSGSGSDIWNNSDNFQYVYQPLNDDGTIVARVASQSNSNPWAKAGVMVRETLAAGSRHAFMAITPGNGVAFQNRTSTGGSSNNTNTGSNTAPYWVKLVRSSSTFTGYASSNGSNWTQIGSTTASMASSVYIGLAVTSHNDGTLSTATFDNVSVTTGSGSSSGQLVTAIDAGGGASGSFVADTGFNTGNQYSDTSSTIDTSGASNAAPQAVWQTCHWNSAFSYTLGSLIAGGSYTVKLDWAELTFQSAGSRQFNVAINGSSVLSNFDVYATAGYKKALQRSLGAKASSSGQIVIAFTQGSADNPFISGIELYKA